MKAVWYKKQGAARDVLVVGEMENPQPGTGEARIRIAFSGPTVESLPGRRVAGGGGQPRPPGGWTGS